MRYGVIGAGVLGMIAALRLLEGGHDVTILEAGDDVGGLAGSFEIEPGIWLEKFYHHLFRTDRSIQALIEELGLAHRLHWYRPASTIQIGDRIHPFDSPAAILRLPELPLRDRVRLLVVVLAAPRQPGDHPPAHRAAALHVAHIV